MSITYAVVCTQYLIPGDLVWKQHKKHRELHNGLVFQLAGEGAIAELQLIVLDLIHLQAECRLLVRLVA